MYYCDATIRVSEPFHSRQPLTNHVHQFAASLFIHQNCQNMDEVQVLFPRIPYSRVRFSEDWDKSKSIRPLILSLLSIICFSSLSKLCFDSFRLSFICISSLPLLSIICFSSLLLLSFMCFLSLLILSFMCFSSLLLLSFICICGRQFSSSSTFLLRAVQLVVVPSWMVVSLLFVVI